MDYRQELNAMGIVPFDESANISNAMNLGNSMLKRRRSIKSQKASAIGMNPVNESFSDEEGIYDATMNNVTNIKNQAYKNRFMEADFVQNSKIKDLQTQMLEDQVNGSTLDDILGIADLGISLADVTGIGAIAGNAFKNMFKKKANKAF